MPDDAIPGVRPFWIVRGFQNPGIRRGHARIHMSLESAQQEVDRLLSQDPNRQLLIMRAVSFHTREGSIDL